MEYNKKTDHEISHKRNKVNNTFKSYSYKNVTKSKFTYVGISLLFLVSVTRASTSYQYMPRTVSRYDKTKTRTGTACENYNNYKAYGYAICDDNATCTNSTVSGVDYIYCTCNSGFKDNGGAYSPLFGAGCIDVDECTLGTHNCDGNATCTNTSGSYICKCNQGYYGDGTSCSKIEDVLESCSPGYYSTSSNTTCRKFLDIECQSNGTVTVKVAMTYVNNILVYPYNQTQGLVGIGFLEPDCNISYTKVQVNNSDGSTELFYHYNLGLSECGFRILRDLQGRDYFDNALILTSQYFSGQSAISSKANYTVFRFQCVYNSTESVVSTSAINHEVDLSIHETGVYQVQMRTYHDANFTKVIEANTKMYDQDAIYVKIEATDSIVELGRQLVIESCKINDYEDSFVKLDIEIIGDFCAMQNHTQIYVENDRSAASFVFWPFLIDDNFEQVSLTCSVYFRDTSSMNNINCSSTVSSRRKREATRNELLPSVYEGAINQNFRLQHGPILRQFELLK